MAQGQGQRSRPDARLRSRWSMRWRRWAALGGAALVAAGLAGCEAQAGPEEVPELPADTEASGPEPEEPENEQKHGPQDYEHPVPGPDIDDDGQAGAEAAAVYFVELYSYVYATGDFEAWDELTTEDCDFCSVVRQSVAEIYASDGYVHTSPPSIQDVSSQVWPDESGDFAVVVIVENAGFKDYDSSGALIEEFPSERVQAGVLVEHSVDGWQVLGSEAEAVE